MSSNSKRLYVDIHVLQNVPPSCINRDDTGSPKTAVYGGVTRARVSSQSWKHAMRSYFKELFDAEDLAVRTKKVVEMVAGEIRKIDSTADAEIIADQVCTAAGLKLKDNKKDKTKPKELDALFFMSIAQAKALAELALHEPAVLKGGKEEKKKLHDALSDNPGIEIALFGRMVADDPTLNTDACAQVAHSISTHKIEAEYDYFTAVDDIAAEDNAGAAHLGTIEYDSATLYRYSTVAVHQLNKYLSVDTAEAMVKYISAFVKSMPSGKQNTFANRTLPYAVMVTVRTDQPVNMAGAFEKPLFAAGNGYTEKSAQALADYANEVYDDFAGKPKYTFVTGKLLSQLGEPIPFDDMLEELQTIITNELAEA